MSIENRRSVPEWVGSSPDAKIPDRVRMRVWERHGGVCHIAKRKIRAGEKWEIDHIIPLDQGGPHRESNLAPALRTEHRKKTAAEARQRAKDNRVKAQHLGLKESRNPLPGGRKSKFKKKIGGRVVLREDDE